MNLSNTVFTTVYGFVKLQSAEHMGNITQDRPNPSPHATVEGKRRRLCIQYNRL